MIKSTENSAPPYICSINISPGGIPKLPIESVRIMMDGLKGDGHNHDKHNNPIQAVCLQDDEVLKQLEGEGYSLSAGETGENITVKNLNVNNFLLGTILEFSGGVVLEISKIRKPCYVLDSISPKLKEDIVGRCGMYAKVLKEGRVTVGETIQSHKPSLVR